MTLLGMVPGGQPPGIEDQLRRAADVALTETGRQAAAVERWSTKLAVPQIFSRSLFEVLFEVPDTSLPDTS